jgi:hypothetical protein
VSERGTTPDADGDVSVGRRALIKRAAAAGAVAWTAPLIVDSLASPAAAATVATGCYRAQRNRNGCGQQGFTNSLVSCDPAGWGTAAAYPDALTVVACSATGSGTTTFEIPASTNCVFVRGLITGALCVVGCLNGTVTAGGKRISFAGGKCNTGNSAYRLIISCGGATC